MNLLPVVQTHPLERPSQQGPAAKFLSPAYLRWTSCRQSRFPKNPAASNAVGRRGSHASRRKSLASCIMSMNGQNAGARRVLLPRHEAAKALLHAAGREFDPLTAHHPRDNLLTRFQAQIANHTAKLGGNACGLICWSHQGLAFRPWFMARCSY